MTNDYIALGWPAESADDMAITHGRMLRTSGRFLVTTSSGSSYVVDLDAETATRIPGDGSVAGWDVASLRRDTEERPLVSVACAVGAPMVLVLDLRGDGVVTLRMTTPVVTIEVLPDVPASDALQASATPGVCPQEA